ncbi:MAG: bifunctional diaminohydroxyphosphoribosylaminopyrimidine deaminase/5-amino-6-(5-phosphoribosylamino)uracil reductase RibD [Candidatus Marinimicrobia bacterium]|nr:bifunctional diaminohydroxyphosphoribosylaminopyrimidine deaminase/5-amino-6-(5-phosphoribosylamino)uracil reductase RibD [Candidatus Neomarinimicrobiota bacterium]
MATLSDGKPVAATTPPSSADSGYMDEALALAQKGHNTVQPNPQVGAVIVQEGRVIGRGYHARYGGPHAEELALAEAGSLAAGATVYITLEPCAATYSGKHRPPCAPALIAAGISRVVCAMTDLNPHVSGKGLQLLRDAGIEVTLGVGADEAATMNRGFLHWTRTGRPYVLAKEAQTSDGYVAAALDGDRWFTSGQARKWAHQLRAQAGAVLIGRGTALADDPALTVREAEGDNPLRVVLDSDNHLPHNLNLFSDNLAPTLVFSVSAAATPPAGWEQVLVDRTPEGLDLGQVLDELGRRNVTLLLVEGGPRVHRSFMEAQLVQEVCIVQAQVAADSAVRSRPDLKAALILPQGWPIRKIEAESPESILMAQQPLNSSVARTGAAAKR